MKAEPYSVYILLCADGSLYTGTARNVEKRTAVHNRGKGARYTRSRLPVHVVYTERCANKRDALRTEYAIKQLSRREKLNRIQKRERLQNSLSCLFSENETGNSEVWTLTAELDGNIAGTIRMAVPDNCEKMPVLSPPETDPRWENSGLEMDLFWTLADVSLKRKIRKVQIAMEAEKEGFFHRFGMDNPETDDRTILHFSE